MSISFKQDLQTDSTGNHFWIHIRLWHTHVSTLNTYAATSTINIIKTVEWKIFRGDEQTNIARLKQTNYSSNVMYKENKIKYIKQKPLQLLPDS